MPASLQNTGVHTTLAVTPKNQDSSIAGLGLAPTATQHGPGLVPPTKWLAHAAMPNTTSLGHDAVPTTSSLGHGLTPTATSLGHGPTPTATSLGKYSSQNSGKVEPIHETANRLLTAQLTTTPDQKRLNDYHTLATPLSTDLALIDPKLVVIRGATPEEDLVQTSVGLLLAREVAVRLFHGVTPSDSCMFKERATELARFLGRYHPLTLKFNETLLREARSRGLISHTWDPDMVTLT